jgi:hypothetical protein
LIHFQVKNILKNNHNHTSKHAHVSFGVKVAAAPFKPQPQSRLWSENDFFAKCKFQNLTYVMMSPQTHGIFNPCQMYCEFAILVKACKH